MFKGKINFYSNQNGQEKKIEKDFDNEKEYNEFIENYPELSSNFFSPKMSLGQWREFDNYMDEFFDRKMGLMFDDFEDDFEDFFEETKSLVDWDKYDNVIEELQEDGEQKKNKQEEKKQKKKKLESALKRLKFYQKAFEGKNKLNTKQKEEMLKDVDNDIKKVEKEINKLK